MDDEDHWILGQQAYHNQTMVHPVGLAVLLALGTLMLILPRRHALTTLLLFASCMPQGQRIVLFTLDFNFIKIMVLFGWARIIMRGEFLSFRWQSLDVWFAAWNFVAFAIHPIVHGGMSSILPRLATISETVGTYYLVRVLIRDVDDLKSLISGMAIISLPVLGFFLYERFTHRNLFSVFGGVPEMTIMRQGKFRCQGAYSHPILAGCYWSAIFPLFIGRLYLPGVGRYLAAIGVVTSLILVAMCNSSTPVMGVLAAITGFALLPLRKSISLVRWGTVLALCCMQLFMKAPVWHLMNTDFIGGSTGWHRAHVIDQFVHYTPEWFLFGSGNIGHWDIFMNDVTNNYVVEAIGGGILALALFIMVHVIAFRNVGILARRLESARPQMIFAWAIGVSLFVHSVNIFGVTYFGQINILWYIGFALTTITFGKEMQRVRPGLKPSVGRTSLDSTNLQQSASTQYPGLNSSSV